MTDSHNVMSLRVISTRSWVALAFGVLALILRVESLHTTTLNGVVTSCSYTDLGGLTLGAITVLLALAAIREATTPLFVQRGWSRRDATIIAAVIAIALGVIGILKGMAIVASPCTDLMPATG